jgi:hypothetical protein
MKRYLLVLAAILLLLPCSCSDNRRLWREQKLPSGKSVKVTSFLLVWGAEHDERIPNNDCLALEFVYTNPDADEEAHEREASEVFELIRPVSEQWGFATATVAAFAAVERARHYDFFIFRRGADRKWSCKRERR